MLDNPLAVGFISTTDPDRARRFYGELLGLELTDDGFALVADLAGAQLRITTLPHFKASDVPAFGFSLADLAAAVAELRAKGIDFVRYDFLGEDQDAAGIWTSPTGNQLAWFKDPDDNLLVLAGRSSQ